jgi:long-chain acyl-CoA synthetase
MSKQSPWPKYNRSMPELFFERSQKWADHVVFRAKEKGAWRDITWSEAERQLLDIAAAVIHEGVQPRARVAILSNNRPAWSYADLGTLTANIVNVPIYPTNTAEQIGYILNDSGAELIFVEDQFQLDKVLAVRSSAPKLRRAVSIEPIQATDFAINLADFVAAGADIERAVIDERCHAIVPEEVATLIYTSGTTGNPKGVMLNHRALVSNVYAVQDFLTMEPGDGDLQFLPLCHAFGRMEAYVFMMHRGTVNFAESIDKIPQNLKEIRPTVFVTVPRLLEKIYEKIQVGLETASPIKRGMFKWAIGVGGRALADREARRSTSMLTRLQLGLADKLVFSKIKDALGGKIRVLGYGAAPLAVDIQRFFASAGVIALEAYGLTETSPGITGNKPEFFKLGSVGRPIPDTEVMIAPDGEILCRGPQVMLGYWNMPEATAEALEDDWFHTGDVGRIDEDGFVWITDRKKDIIITAGGKNISPQNIENQIKLDPAIEQIAIVGDRRKFLVALIVPGADWLSRFATEKGLKGAPTELVKEPAVVAEIERRLAAANKTLAKYETIKKFKLIADEFSVENNLLTPTMKVRRKNVMERYGALIEALYGVEK